MTDRGTNAASFDADPVGVPNEHVDTADHHVIPLLSEEAIVSRRRVETEVVRVATVTRSREARIDEPVVHERVEVVRTPIGHFVDAAPPVREEGDTTIIPVIEETIVVERRLFLKEEVRLTRVRVTEQHRETVVLREQEAVITRRRPDTGPDLPDGDKRFGPDA